ncbi:restriction endonuclease [Leucobacter salsicius]|uniref:restriction endonuclease n=1 Tax=Leucobacter salsicius TaxID=664638 RepID=UPI00037F4719|nr:restriction endonuclease [Leucobacter salsicius]
MITPTAYEHLVARHFERLGYRTQVTSLTNDYGLDAIAENDHERVAIQAKLYGHTSRQVNRQMIMELHGVKDYFDCDRAVLATDGIVRSDAREVAAKLSVTLLELSADTLQPAVSTERVAPTTGLDAEPETFESVWMQYILPLAGRTLSAADGRKNEIVAVDWAELKRVSSTGRLSSIDIEIFRLAITRLLAEGSITRDEINQNYARRASSAVILVLSQVPFFVLERKPRIQLTYIPRGNERIPL